MLNSFSWLGLSSLISLFALYHVILCPHAFSSCVALYHYTIEPQPCDAVQGAQAVIIVEGEMDKLAMNEAGLWNVISVPAGAVKTVRAQQPGQAKFGFVSHAADALSKCTYIILATDGDAPGQTLAEELALRLGKDRCLRLHWPDASVPGGVKDANDALMTWGPARLNDYVIKAAKPMGRLSV